MSKDYINYHKIIDTAMREVVKNVLNVVARDGIQGDHDIFISFLTTAPDVTLSERMYLKYPFEIRIELQHQFSELKVEKEYFSVRLSFGGISEVVVVPYRAITSFEDAGTKFSLEFNYHDLNLEPDDKDISIEPLLENEQEISSSNVIVLDKFRKNKK